MHRYPVLGVYQLCSNDAQYFSNTRSNDVMYTTKFDWQRMIMSPNTDGDQSVLTISRSNARIVAVHGLEINDSNNQSYNALRITNSNIGNITTIRSILTSDKGSMELALNSSVYTPAHNSLSNVRNVGHLRNFVGDMLLAAQSGAPSVFLSSNDGFVGVNQTMPLTWLHVQASNVLPLGHFTVERTNTGGYGGQMSLRNATPLAKLGNATCLAFNLHSARIPYETLTGADRSHARIAAFLDSNDKDYTSLRFSTDSNEGMRLDTDGHLGVGCINPITHMHVKSRFDNSANIYMGSNLSSGYSLRKDHVGNLMVVRGVWETPSNTMIMTTDGRWGFNSTPSTSTDIQLRSPYLYDSTLSNNVRIMLGADTSTGYMIQKHQDGRLRMLFGSSTSQTECLQLGPTGLVGIGNVGACTHLHVKSLTETSGHIYLGSNETKGYSLIKDVSGSLFFRRGSWELYANTMELTTDGRLGFNSTNIPTTTDIILQSAQSDRLKTVKMILGTDTFSTIPSQENYAYMIEKSTNSGLIFYYKSSATSFTETIRFTKGYVGINGDPGVIHLKVVSTGHITNNLSVGSTYNDAYNMYVAGTLYVTGSGTINGGATVYGGLTVKDGGADITGNSKVTGTFTSTKKLTVDTDGLTVTAGGATISGNSSVTGTFKSTNKLTVDAGGLTVTAGGLTVTAGGAAISGNSSVTGTFKSTNTLTVDAGGLTVTAGGATITGNSSVTGTFKSTNTLTVDAGGLTVTAGGATITGNSKVTGTLTATNTLTVDAGGLTVTAGNSSFKAGVTIDETLTVKKNILATGNSNTISADYALLVANGGIRNNTTRTEILFATTLLFGDQADSYKTKMTLSGTGDLTCTGNVTAYSDARLKTKLLPITNALNKLNKMNGYTYLRSDRQDNVRQVGLLAQEVQQVLPEAVSTDTDTGLLSLQYGNVSALIVEAIKELTLRVDMLEKENLYLRSLINMQ